MRRPQAGFSLAMCVLAASGAAACGKHAPADSPPPPLDRSTIYPLVVTTNDLPTGPVRRPLIEGLVVTLAAAPAQGVQAPPADQSQPAGQAKLLRETDLQGLALDDAYTIALANLEGAARRGEIAVHAEVDASGHTVDVVWGHDWRAAACILLPGARQQAFQQLAAATGSASAGSAGAGSATSAPAGSAAAKPMPAIVYAAIPNRDVLVLFADPAVAQKALAAEKSPARKLTDHILRLVPTDKPFWVQPPVAWAE